jgi:cell wall-associated NlpC family hydrolase
LAAFRVIREKPRLAGVFFAHVFIIVACLLAACQPAPAVRRSPVTQTNPMTPRSNENAANAIAFRAFSLVGRPYVYGAENPEVGFDCSGFVRFVVRDTAAIDLPRTAAAQSERGRLIASTSSLRVGDLVFFRESGRIFHVGLFVGEGRFVHAPRTGKNVELSSLIQGYWGTRFAHGRRIL